MYTAELTHSEVHVERPQDLASPVNASPTDTPHADAPLIIVSLAYEWLWANIVHTVRTHVGQSSRIYDICYK